MNRTDDETPAVRVAANSPETLPTAVEKSAREPESDEPASLAEKLSRRVFRARKKPWNRNWRVALLVIGILVVIAGIVYLVYAPSHAVRVNISARQNAHPGEGASESNKSPDDVTGEALAEVKTILAKPGPSAASSSTAASASLGQHAQAGVPPPPLSLPPETFQANKPADVADRQPSQPASRRNQERSIRFTLKDTGDKPSTDLSRTSPSQKAAQLRAENHPDLPISARSENTRAGSSRPTAAPVVLPSFGAILPVRTLGKIYTLRSGSTVRLELTRFVAGEGWSLPKGTTLIGQIRGSEQDRAFIAITGFIDRDRDRFVKLGGEILGDDGGSGLKGKFHKLSSGWSRAFARVASTAVNVAGAVASSRISGQPVIITDAGSRAITPFSSEIDSSLLQQARGFVEIPAGTTAFVMVTTLPAGVEGIDADPQSGSNSANLTGGSTNQSSPLTQEELATLLTSGDPIRIREALPRMSPQMRSIAEVVLAESGRQSRDRD